MSARDEERIPGLDGLRAFAVLAVILSHVNAAVGGLPLRRLWGAGWLGVDLFFALSGFLITAILLRTRSRPAYFGRFYLRRALRIMPLYYGFLLIALFVLPGSSAGHATGFHAYLDEGWVAALLLYYANLKQALLTAPVPGFAPLSHLWSLSVEEHFYLLWPTIVLWCRTRTLVRVCLVGALVACLCRVAVVLAALPPGLGYAATPCRVDALLLGSLLAVARENPGWWSLVRRGAPRALLAAAVVIVAVAASNRRDPWLFDAYEPPSMMIGMTALSVACTALVAMVLDRDGRLSRLCALRPLQRIGQRSYAMYLLQYVVLFPLGDGGRRLGWTQTTGGRVALAVAAVALVFAVAEASYWLYERPFLKLKERLAPPR